MRTPVDSQRARARLTAGICRPVRWAAEYRYAAIMRALTVVPAHAGSLRLEELPNPEPNPGDLLVQGLAVGVYGTDKEIVAGHYGWAPPTRERLVLGHESLGRVVRAPPGTGFSVGDLVVDWRPPPAGRPPSPLPG